MLDRLFSPLEFAGLRAKNRLVMAPMGTGLPEHDGTCNDRTIAYYRRRAEITDGRLAREYVTIVIQEETRTEQLDVGRRTLLTDRAPLTFDSTLARLANVLGVPKETRHRLENPGSEPLQIIEVQNGPYLGEDDIVRFHDDYGRNIKR